MVARRRILHTAFIHRHGDRTPITKLAQPALWNDKLPAADCLRDLEDRFPVRAAAIGSHHASGVIPFGQLTSLGLTQLTNLGAQLRSQFEHAGEPVPTASQISCHATPFARTIQSAQALLSGMELEGGVQIDTSLGQLLLPDPEPRHPRQAELEAQYWAATEPPSSHLLQLEERCVNRFLEVGAITDKAPVYKHGAVNWNRVAEIGKCLEQHWPEPVLEPEDLAAVLDTAAARWYGMFRMGSGRELTRYAIGGMLRRIVRIAQLPVHERPTLDFYSAHDSTLMGLLAALQCRHSDGRVVSEWPPYASFLKIQLIDADGDTAVRCTYNNEEMLLDGRSCRDATRELNALTSQPFDQYSNLFPLEAVLRDVSDVLFDESR